MQRSSSSEHLVTTTSLYWFRLIIDNKNEDERKLSSLVVYDITGLNTICVYTLAKGADEVTITHYP
jgi:hypothetical protein